MHNKGFKTMSTFKIKQETITDLSTDLNEKQDKSDAVTIDDNQTITGKKTFTLQLPIAIERDSNQQEVPSQTFAGQIGLYRNKTYSKGDGYTSWVQGWRDSNGYNTTSLYVRRFLDSDEKEIVAEVNVIVDQNGNKYGTAPSPLESATGTEIATAKWSRDNISMVPGNFIDLTLGASNSKYIAPANGYLVFQKSSNAANQEIRLTNLNNRLVGYANTEASTGRALGCTVPCKKGDTILIFYSAGGNTEYFRFVCAK